MEFGPKEDKMYESIKKSLWPAILTGLILFLLCMPQIQSDYELVKEGHDSVSFGESEILWATELMNDGNQITNRQIIRCNQQYLITGFENFPSYDYGGSRIVLDADGNILNYYCYGPEDRTSFLVCSLFTSSGDILSLGSYSVGELNRDLWFLKTDSNHVVEWQQMYGGYETESAKEILALDDGGYLLLGYTGSFGEGWYDIWLVRTDGIGNELWNLTYGDVGDDYGVTIIPVDDGYLILGRIMESTDYDLILIKINDTGEVQWQKTFDGNGEYSMDFCRDAVLLPNGNVLIVVVSEDSFTGEKFTWLLTVDQNGNNIDSLLYGQGQEAIWKLMSLSDGGYLGVGSTASYGTYNNESQQREDDMWVVKFDETLTIEWMKSFGGQEDDFIRDFCLDNEGNIVAIATLGSYDENTSQYALKIQGTPIVERSFFVGFLKSNNKQGHVNVWTPGFLMEKNDRGVIFHTSNDQFIIRSSSSPSKQYGYFAFGAFDVLDRN